LVVRRDRASAEAVAEEAEALGAHARVLLADVRDQEAVAAALNEAGPVDVLVNNAAVRREQPFTEISADDWHEILGVVLDGAFNTCVAVLPGMAARGHGRIVNIAGVTGQTGAALRAHVVTAKAGLICLTKALALEYASSSITVNAVSPGLIDTVPAGEAPHHQNKQIPVGRPGQPDEVAAAVAYLASPEAAFVTGQTINVNGGKIGRASWRERG